MRLQLLTFTAILLASISSAQETVLEDNSLSGQFDKIYRTSTSYQKYKVISKENFLQLKQGVLDLFLYLACKLAKQFIILFYGV